MKSIKSIQPGNVSSAQNADFQIIPHGNICRYIGQQIIRHTIYLLIQRCKNIIEFIQLAKFHISERIIRLNGTFHLCRNSRITRTDYSFSPIHHIAGHKRQNASFLPAVSDCLTVRHRNEQNTFRQKKPLARTSYLLHIGS